MSFGLGCVHNREVRRSEINNARGEEAIIWELDTVRACPCSAMFAHLVVLVAPCRLQRPEHSIQY